MCGSRAYTTQGGGNQFSLAGRKLRISWPEPPARIAATAFNINVLKQGNVHTQTMRAFTVEEMTKILAHVD